MVEKQYAIMVNRETHKSLKQMSLDEEIPMGELVKRLVKWKIDYQHSMDLMFTDGELDLKIKTDRKNILAHNEE